MEGDKTLKEKRVSARLTQQQVADKAGIKLQQYQKFESGERNLRTASFQIACRVLEALDLDIVQIVTKLLRRKSNPPDEYPTYEEDVHLVGAFFTFWDWRGRAWDYI